MARKNKGPKDIAKLMNSDAFVTRALRKGVRQALRMHKLLGNPVCEWRDGKVVWIPASKIRVPRK